MRATSLIVPDKQPTREDVAIAERLLGAYRAAADSAPPTTDADLWTLIEGLQRQLAAVLRNGDPTELATYLCNAPRQDVCHGIGQGHLEFARISRDATYRRALERRYWDRLVSLGEAVGAVPVENPEQGPSGVSLRSDPLTLTDAISRRVGVDIAPPDVDGGLLKLDTSRGRFAEPDLHAIYTAYLLTRVRGGNQRVCEIGGGSGRAAYWSHRMGLTSYTVVDLPRINVIQGWYLLKTLPRDHVVLHGEEGPEDGVRIEPGHAAVTERDRRYDIVLNEDSFPEMSPGTVDAYLGWIKQVAGGGLLVSINHESKPPYGRGHVHVSVPEAVERSGGFQLDQRFPYWLRRGYVMELYRTPI